MVELQDLGLQLETLPWLALAASLLIFAVLNPGVHLIWFGVSAVVVGLAGLAANIAWQWQLVAFGLIALAAFFFVRRQGVDYSSAGDAAGKAGQQYIGRVVTVADSITNGRGSVQVDEAVWSAEGEDAPKDARVKVTGVKGMSLVVKRITG